MKKILFFSLMLVLAFAGTSSASNVYNWGNTDTNELLKYAFDTASGHDHDGVNSKAVTSTGPIAALTSGTIAGVTINNSVIGGTTAAAITGTTITANTGLMPDANDGAYIGSATVSFSDLFLASGGVINWANGNATLTHSTGLLTSNVPLSIGTSNALTAGTIELGAAADTTISRSAAGAVQIEGKQVFTNGAATALTAGTTVTLTVVAGNALFTDTITTDNQDQTINASGGGSAGDRMTIIFITDTGGSADEVITFGTNIRSTGTLTLADGTAERYLVSFVSDGTKWNEVSRTAKQAA